MLKTCLDSASVNSVRAITRRPLALGHPKLTTVLHTDFEHYEGIAEAFTGIDLCLYCLGKSVSQVEGEAAYRRLTHDFAMAAASALKAANPDAVFHFISGSGASLDSRFMWARVKAETERDLLATANAVCWRPAAIDGLPSASEPIVYRLARPVFRLLRPMRGLYISGEDIGLAMIQGAVERIRGRIIENREMRDLADRARQLHQLEALRRR